MSKVTPKLSVPAYARRRGCSRQAVAKALREGRITATPEGLVDPISCDAQWAANTRPRAKPSKAWTAAGLAALAEGIAGVMMDDEGRPEIFDEGLPHLMSVLGHLSESAVQALVLPPRVDAAVRAWPDLP